MAGARDVGDAVKFDQIRAAVKGVPFICDENARMLYDLVLDGERNDCLELGFAHGVASCYIAGAIDELGSGSLTSVDLLSAGDWQVPSIEELLGRLGLTSFVRIVRTHTGYNWFLRDEIRRRTGASGGCEPAYDLCIIDGPKNWTIVRDSGFPRFEVARDTCAGAPERASECRGRAHRGIGGAPVMASLRSSSSSSRRSTK